MTFPSAVTFPPRIIAQRHCSQQDESPMEIMERFIEQDRELGKDLELLEHLKPAAEDTGTSPPRN